jgi:two-component system osmolarity sensor histidine kinase EnvZ
MMKVVKPFKFLKKFLPRSFFGRSLIIVIAPVFFVQTITAYIFIDRHLDKVTQLLAADIAGKISGAVDFLTTREHLKGNLSLIQGYISRHYNLEFHMVFSKAGFSRSHPSLPYKGGLFQEELKNRLSYPFKVIIEDEALKVQVDTPKGSFIFKDQLKHLYPKTTKILLWWIIITPLIFLVIAIIFLRNQIKPLRRLSEAVVDFGRGKRFSSLKPTGSSEVRRVTHAFNVMKERITRQITQRTEMLAGISHDLKTPLTRMELQLAIMEPSSFVEQLREEVREMSSMLEEFLAFAKGEEGEDRQKQNFTELLKAIAMKYDFTRITLKMPEEEVWFSYRQNAMTRCLSNLVTNSLKYAESLSITLKCEQEYLELYFDDDGPGIEEAYREKVFRPFFRLDKSRNSETGGVGLGLAITRDIVNSHGGRISLEESPLGGLRVLLRFPL